MRPQLLVLDEPTVGLDRIIADRFLDAVRELNRQGVTVVMISHDMRAVARCCTHLLRMDGGRIAEWGELRRQAADAAGADTETERSGQR